MVNLLNQRRELCKRYGVVRNECIKARRMTVMLWRGVFLWVLLAVRRPEVTDSGRLGGRHTVDKRGGEIAVHRVKGKVGDQDRWDPGRLCSQATQGSRNDILEVGGYLPSKERCIAQHTVNLRLP